MTSVGTAGAVTPTYFGDARRQLFGVHHEPATGASLDALGASGVRHGGVVLCPPGPHEYRQTHWAIRGLATRLAECGLAVLRFDYYGTGDSAGASDAGTLAQWTDDVRAAASELADHAGVRRVSIVGLRLGAALAVRACAAGLAVHDLVLWDPVVSGRVHLAELERAQAWQQREAYYPEDPRRALDELVGLPMPAALRAELAALDLGVEPLGRPARATLVSANGDASDDASDDALAARLRVDGVACTRHVVDDPSLRRADDWQHDVLRPQTGLLTIVERLARRAP